MPLPHRFSFLLIPLISVFLNPAGARTLRRDEDSFSIAQLLLAPYFQSLVDLAIHMTNLEKSIPLSLNQPMGVLEPLAAQEVAVFQHDHRNGHFKRVKDVQPHVNNLIRITMSGTATPSAVEKSASSILQALKQIEGQSEQHEVSLPLALEPSMTVLDQAKKALHDILELSQNQTIKFMPLREDFVVLHYIPCHEKVFEMHHQLEKMGLNKPKLESYVNLKNTWTVAHDLVMSGAQKAFSAIHKLKRQLNRNENAYAEACKRLPALYKLSPEIPGLFKLSGLHSSTLNRKIENLLEQVQQILHGNLPPTPEDKVPDATLQIFLGNLERASNMMSKLQELHILLHEIWPKIRYQETKLHSSHPRRYAATAAPTSLQSMIKKYEAEVRGHKKRVAKDLSQLLIDDTVTKNIKEYERDLENVLATLSKLRETIEREQGGALSNVNLSSVEKEVSAFAENLEALKELSAQRAEKPKLGHTPY